MTPVRRTAARIVALGLGAAMLAALPSGAPAAAEDPVDGALTSGDPLFPHQGNGGYDVQHYDVDLAWTPGVTLALSTIAATVEVDAVTTGAPLSSYALDLEGSSLVVSEVTVNGTPAGFTRVDGTGIEPPAAHKLVITPAAPVSGAFSTVITYGGIPSSHTDSDGSSEGWNVTSDGATFLAQPIGSMAGLPVNNTPADKATFTIALDVPTTITTLTGSGASAAISNGELLSRTPNGDGTRTTWTWNQVEQMATELILISIGKYDVVESTVTLSDGRTIPEWSFIDSAQSTVNKTTFTNRRAQLSTYLQRLETLFGPYPGNSTGIVMDAVPSGISYALETQDRSFFPSVGSLAGDTLFHELAHQWYGDAVSPTVWNDIWINEGMGTWGPTWYDHVLAPATPDPAAVETTYFTSWDNTASTSASWNTPPAGMTMTSQLYGYQTYTRGAQLYEALRTAIGTPDYLAFVAEWQVRYGGGNGGAAAFEALAEEISGRDLTTFFRDWVHEPGKPAWPFKHDLALTAPTGPVAPGSTLTYTVTATNTGKVAMTPVIEVDLADVLDEASLDPATLPAGTVLDGTTLTWTVPSTPVTTGSNVAEIAVPVIVDPDASDRTLAATARAATLGSTCAACSTSNVVPVQPIPPASGPTITGIPQVDVELTGDPGDPGDWAEGVTLHHQWLADGTPIEGATGLTFTPGPAQVGLPLAFRVTGLRPGSATVVRTSASTARVAPGEQVLRPTPEVRGTHRVGATLTALAGTWDDGGSLGYRWLRDGTPIAGAVAASHTLRPVDLGARMSVVVTSRKPGYADASSASVVGPRVALGSQVRRPKPRIASIAGVAGGARVGRLLTALPGAHDPGVSLRFRWLAGGARIAGATARTFRPGARLAGKRIKVTVVAGKPGYQQVARTSSPTNRVRR